MSENTVNNLREKQVGEYFDGMKLTRRQILAGSILFFAFIVEAWELMILVFIADGIAVEFSLSAFQIGSIIGAMSFGLILGCYLWGF